MPYRRYRTKRRRVYRKRRDNVKKVRRAVKKLQKQVELKTFDTVIENVSVPQVPINYSFLQPVASANQDVTAHGFIGRRYQVKSIMVRGFMEKITTNGAASAVRIIFIWDKFYNDPSIVPTMDRYYASVDDTVLATAIPHLTRPLRRSQVKNVKVLYDRTFQLGHKRSTVDQAYSGGNGMVAFKFYRKINLPTEFNAGNEYTKGRLTALVMDENNGESVLKMNVRMYYTDS